MHRLSAIFGCSVFLINGFSNTNMHAQMGLPYYFSPILLLSLMSLADKASFKNFSLAVAAHALCMSCTFLPILLLVLSSAHLLSLAYAHSVSSPQSRFLRCLWLQASSALLGFFLLAPLYFPIIESFFVVDLFSTYNSRTYYPLPKSSIFSWFSAKHFWESYKPLDPAYFNPESCASIFFHMGALALFFAFQVVVLANDKFRKFK